MRRIHLKVLMIIILLTAVVTIELKGQSQVVVEYGAEQELSEQLAQRSTELLKAVNAWQINGTDIFSDEPGVSALKEAIELHNFIAAYDTLGTGIIRNGETLEIPNIYLHNTEAGEDTFLELTFIFSKNGQFQDVRISGNEYNFDRFISRNIRIEDREQKRYLEDFLQSYSRAFASKDLEAIASLFDDDSFIIAGKQSLDHVGFMYYRDNFKEYMERIEEEILTPENEIQVIFADPVFYRHPDYKEIYGVTVRQIWHSSDYSDAGHLFLIVDGREEEPKVMARKWQEANFKASKYSIEQPNPLVTGVRLREVKNGEYSGLEKGTVLLTLKTEENTTDIEMVKSFLEDGFLQFDGVEVETGKIQQDSRNSLTVPFTLKNPEHKQQIPTVVSMYPTAKLEGFKKKLELYPGRINEVEFTIGSVASVPSPHLFSELEVEANTDSIRVDIFSKQDELIGKELLKDSTSTLQLLEGDYRLVFNRRGFIEESHEITRTRNEYGTFALELEKEVTNEPVIAKEKKSFFSKKKMWLIGGAAIAITGAAGLLSGNGGSEGIGIPIPPGRPGFR